MIYEIMHASTILSAFILFSLTTFFILKKAGFFKALNQLPRQQRIGRTVGIIVAFSLFCSIVAKIFALFYPDTLPMYKKLEQFGLYHLTFLVFISELIVGSLLLNKNIYKLGILLGIVSLSAAVTSHLPTHADGIIWAIPSGSLLTLLWISALLSAPEMFPENIIKFFRLNKIEMHS